MSFETLPRAGGEYQPEDTIELDGEQIRRTIIGERLLLGMDTSDLVPSSNTQPVRPETDPLISGDAKSTLEFEPLDPSIVTLGANIPATDTDSTEAITAALPLAEPVTEPLIVGMRPVNDEPIAAVTKPVEDISQSFEEQFTPSQFSSGVTNHRTEKVRKPLNEYLGIFQAIPGLIDRIPFDALSEKLRALTPETRRKALMGLMGSLAFTGIMFGAVNALDSDSPERPPTAVQPEKSESAKPSPSQSEETPRDDSDSIGGGSGSGDTGSYEPPIVTTDRQDQDTGNGNLAQTPSKPQNGGTSQSDKPSKPGAGQSPTTPSTTPEKPNGPTGKPSNPGSTPTKPGTGEPTKPSTEPTQPGGGNGGTGTPTQPNTPGGEQPTSKPTEQTQEPGGEPSNPSGPGEQPSSPRPTMTQTAPQTPPQETPPQPEPTPTKTMSAEPSFSQPAATSQPPEPEAPTQAPSEPAQPPAEVPTTQPAPQPTQENPQAVVSPPASD